MKNLVLEFFDQIFSGTTDNIDAKHTVYRYALCGTLIAIALVVQVGRNSLTSAMGHVEDL